MMDIYPAGRVHESYSPYHNRAVDIPNHKRLVTLRLFIYFLIFVFMYEVGIFLISFYQN